MLQVDEAKLTLIESVDRLTYLVPCDRITARAEILLSALFEEILRLRENAKSIESAVALHSALDECAALDTNISIAVRA